MLQPKHCDNNKFILSSLNSSQLNWVRFKCFLFLFFKSSSSSSQLRKGNSFIRWKRSALSYWPLNIGGLSNQFNLSKFLTNIPIFVMMPAFQPLHSLAVFWESFNPGNLQGILKWSLCLIYSGWCLLLALLSTFMDIFSCSFLGLLSYCLSSFHGVWVYIKEQGMNL